MAAINNSISRYPIPVPEAPRPCRSRLEVRKSVFIASSCHCGAPEDFKNFLAMIRQSAPDATHHCWAFLLGPPGDTARIGYSDDGEPHGTAGRPILEALLHSGIGQVGMVVSRWFGGTKLGTGGLARAYRDAAMENLRQLEIVDLVPGTIKKISVPYPWLDATRRVLALVEGRVEKEDYGEHVCLEVTVPSDRAEEFPGMLRDLTQGNVNCQDL